MLENKYALEHGSLGILCHVIIAAFVVCCMSWIDDVVAIHSDSCDTVALG